MAVKSCPFCCGRSRANFHKLAASPRESLSSDGAAVRRNHSLRTGWRLNRTPRWAERGRRRHWNPKESEKGGRGGGEQTGEDHLYCKGHVCAYCMSVLFPMLQGSVLLRLPVTVWPVWPTSPGGPVSGISQLWNGTLGQTGLNFFSPLPALFNLISVQKKCHVIT